MTRGIAGPAGSWRLLFWRFVTDRPLLDVAGAAVVLALACAEIAVPWLLQKGVDAAAGWPTALPLPIVSLVLAAVLGLIVGLRAAALLIETWLFSGASFELRRQLCGHFLHRPLAEVSHELDLNETAVRRWVHQAEIDAGQRPGLTSSEHEELVRLRKENKVLREERDILKRATAFFARGDR